MAVDFNAITGAAGILANLPIHYRDIRAADQRYRGEEDIQAARRRMQYLTETPIGEILQQRGIGIENTWDAFMNPDSPYFRMLSSDERRMGSGDYTTAYDTAQVGIGFENLPMQRELTKLAGYLQGMGMVSQLEVRELMKVLGETEEGLEIMGRVSTGQMTPESGAKEALKLYQRHKTGWLAKFADALASLFTGGDPGIMGAPTSSWLEESAREPLPMNRGVFQ